MKTRCQIIADDIPKNFAKIRVLISVLFTFCYLYCSFSSDLDELYTHWWWCKNSVQNVNLAYNIVSLSYTILFSFRDVKTTKFNQYFPVVLMSHNEFIARFQKPVMFWKRRHCGIPLWRHGGGAWHNGLFRTTASNVRCGADVANQVTKLWQASDTENFGRRITG